MSSLYKALPTPTSLGYVANFSTLPTPAGNIRLQVRSRIAGPMISGHRRFPRVPTILEIVVQGLGTSREQKLPEDGGVFCIPKASKGTWSTLPIQQLY